MKTVLDDKTIIEFHNSDSLNEPMVVSRFLPDNSTEAIGNIYQTWDESANDVSVVYECRGVDGEELIPPTTDWLQAEEAFVKYAKSYPSKSALEKEVENGNVLAWHSRPSEIKNIRRKRIYNMRISK